MTNPGRHSNDLTHASLPNGAGSHPFGQLMAAASPDTNASAAVIRPARATLRALPDATLPMCNPIIIQACAAGPYGVLTCVKREASAVQYKLCIEGGTQ